MRDHAPYAVAADYATAYPPYECAFHKKRARLDHEPGPSWRFCYLLVDEAAPPGPLEVADPPLDPPLLLEAAPPPLPEVLPELGAELGAGAVVVLLELDDDDLPALPPPGVMTVVSFFCSHALRANAPRMTNTQALVFRYMVFSLW